MSLNVYIPVHLRKIKIIDQLQKLISEKKSNPAYNEEEIDDSFESYNSYLANDPVETFVKFCLPKESIKVGDYEVTINYITHLFYSVKGTIKVIEFMKKFLNLDLNEDFFYSPKKIRLSFKGLNTLNDSLFYDLLRNFLNALLYFNTAVISTTTNTLELTDNVKNMVGSKIITYKVFEIDSTEIFNDEE
jgi:hypothetical protein